MTAWTNFPKNLVQPETHTAPRPRFSLTSDIISFRKCRRQYGYFGQDGFVAAQAVQIFFGQIIHQVLDRCHRHYSGFFGHPKGTLPTDANIEQYFDEVEQALRAHGVRPASPVVATQAKQVLKTFNSLEGPTLYPRVKRWAFERIECLQYLLGLSRYDRRSWTNTVSAQRLLDFIKVLFDIRIGR